MEKNCVVLYKAGKFYSAYGDCGIIIHNLMGYKYVEYKHSAGFPESSIAKVKKADIVLNKAGGGVLFSKDELDLTQAVIDQVNKPAKNNTADKNKTSSNISEKK